MKIKPQATNNYLVVDIEAPKEEKIGVISKTAQGETKNRWGKVSSVGPGVSDIDGVRVPMNVSEGDLVYAASHGHMPVDLTKYGIDLKFTVVSVMDVLVVVKDMETLDATPLGNYVEIEKIEKKSGGIELPDDKKYPTGIGKVVKLGTGWTTIGGVPLKFDVQVGDIVAFNPYNLRIVDWVPLGINKKTYLCFTGELLSVLKKVE